MRIVSWNVNGLRALARKGFLDWLEASGAEIVGLQEVRARREQLPEDVARPPGWHVDVVAAERGGYSGVALYSRRAPDAVDSELGDPEIDAEGRLQVARFGRLLVVNSYFPNGNGVNRDLSRIPFKLGYYRKLFAALEPAKERGEPIVVMGDFNTAHQDVDLARPKQNRETSGFRPEERAELDRWLRRGWIDAFRQFEPGGGHYTWWSQRKGVREKNVGWRIDYHLVSPGARPYLERAEIHAGVTGSDHCPISIVMNDAVLGTLTPGPSPRGRGE
ncbi:MAG TPA: exodeoxyribonuclease III [Thermoanaerobaculia bacterium]|jgi:exodeoxyribonuclease-3